MPGRTIRTGFLNAKWPDDLADPITAAYRALSKRSHQEMTDVAVRSSATAEDLPEASFAGQQESFLNIRGEAALLDACRRCYASLFTDRAISYRNAKGFDHLKVALSIGVQKMVRSDKGASGVMFSIDTETGFDKVVLINAAWGLGENVVQGAVDPDEYQVFKPFLDKPALVPIVDKRLGGKALKMIYAAEGSERPVRNVPTSKAERESYVLSDAEILQLARWAVTIEQHYAKAMDMEWAKDGETGELFLVQARPETVQSRKAATAIRSYRVKAKGRKLITGLSIGDAAVSAPVRLIRSPREIDRFVDGAVLVTETTDPDWVPIMKRAAAIVTDHGGRTSHAAIVSRELGLPAIVGTGRATEILHDDQEITVSCAEGTEGYVYEGKADIEVEELSLADIPATRTKVMLNIGNPAAAFHWWRLPAEGVGLARMEFVINTQIRIHPMALVRYDTLKDEAAKQEIAELTKGYEDKTEYFVERLALSLGPDRGGALSQARHRADERFQDQRIRQSARRQGVRAEGGKPDARLPRGVALLLAELPRGLRAGMQGPEAAARGHRARQCDRDDPVLPLDQGGRPGSRGDGRGRLEARRERPAGLCDVRDPVECRAGRSPSPSVSTASRSAATT